MPRILPVFLALGLSLLSAPIARPALPAESLAAEWVTTEGRTVTGGNPRDADGRIREFHAPALRLLRTKAATPAGTVLVFPGGGYALLAIDHEGDKVAEFLNARGFDVAILEYHIAKGGRTSRDEALADARAAWKLLRTDAEALGLRKGRLAVMGFSAGGNLAARLSASLPREEQPDALALVYPAYLDETLPGKDTPAVLPPAAPRRLFLEIAANDKTDWVKSSEAYAKAWVARGGAADWRILSDGGHGYGMKPGGLKGAVKDWPDRLVAFLAATPPGSPVSR